jgi:peptidoglycan/LPS O-acetylase OafA/YrhL
VPAPASGPSSAPPGLGYVPALDGLRAVAITLVVTHHAFDWPSGGWLGVDLFFVLSGFLITTLLLERRGRESIGHFYQRRALRLLPALVLLLMVALAVDQSLFGMLAGLGYFSNLLMAGGHPAELPQSFSHLWSLAAEEQFYIVWPFVLYFAIRLGTRASFSIAAGAAIVSTVLAFVLFVVGASGYRLFYAPDTRAAPILVGCALALGLQIRPLSLRRLEIPALALVLGLVLTMDYARLSVSGPPILLFALAGAVLIVRALHHDVGVSRVLSLAPFVFVGRISYSLYLWHWPLFVWLGVAGGFELLDVPVIALAVVLAIGSHYLIERPFLRLKPAARFRSPSRTVIAPDPVPDVARA